MIEPVNENKDYTDAYETKDTRILNKKDFKNRYYL